MALEALRPGETLPDGARVVVSRLGGSDVVVPPWAVVGLGRQDELLAHADLVICGGGHGLVSKTLLAGVPMVVVPGGGDQWEIANRLVRQGSAQLVRPLTTEALATAVERGVVGAAVPTRRLDGQATASRRSKIRYGCAMKHSRHRRRLARVRLTEFQELVEGQFGPVRGASMLVDHVLTAIGGRTAAQAIEDGVDPRDVWRALCADFDVPRDQW